MRRTFVASSRPPRPASTTATSTRASRERGERGRGHDLELGRADPLRRRRTRPTASSKSASAPSTRIRSLQPATCGEIVEPTESPSERSSCSIVIVAVDFPFVPTTWTAGIGVLRVAELGEQRVHPLEPEPVAGPRREGVEPLDSGHAPIVGLSFALSVP